MSSNVSTERSALVAKKRLARNLFLAYCLIAGIAIALWPVVLPYFSAQNKSAITWILLTVYYFFTGTAIGGAVQESGEYMEAREGLKKLNDSKS